MRGCAMRTSWLYGVQLFWYDLGQERLLPLTFMSFPCLRPKILTITKPSAGLWGWISEGEREILRSKRVAIAGLGGVGGLHFITLVRLGVTKFNVAELDQVELANFNRQVCAGFDAWQRQDRGHARSGA